MKRPGRAAAVLGALACALLLVGCGTTEPVPTDNHTTNPFDQGKIGTDSTLEVMTWNLKEFPLQNGTTVTNLIQAVQGLDVDIVALQEIDSAPYFQQVLDGLPGWTGYRANTAYAEVNLAYIYRTDGPVQVNSVYEILTEYRSTRNEGGPLPRSPLVLEGTFRGRDFVVIDNHYKCCGDGNLDLADVNDEETRRYNASLLLDDFIRTNFADKPVILVGDLNDRLTDSRSDNVYQNFLDAPDMYRFVDMDIALDDQALWSYPSSHSHFDHILITAPLFDAVPSPATQVEVVPVQDYLGGGWQKYADQMSDHLPVAVRLQF